MGPDTTFIVLPFVVAFAVSMLFAPGIIATLKRRGVGQTISEDGPESHRPKAGTPTMGGLIILAGILAGVVPVSRIVMGSTGSYAAARQMNLEGLLAVVLLITAYALLGMLDDYLTINPRGGVRGIPSKPKAAVQALLAVAFVMWLSSQAGFTPALYVAGKPLLAGVTYWIFAVVFIVGMANFVNITDGLDGLVAGLTAIASAAFAWTIIMSASAIDSPSLSLFALPMAIAGACVAFLWFNTNPARVFMGDTGALALGVGLPAVAIMTHREVLLIVVGLVFVLDGLSSALQWAVFKYTRVTSGTGRRVFRKSPIHHHFELSGWPEQAVVVRFWIVGAVAALLGFAGAMRGWW